MNSNNKKLTGHPAEEEMILPGDRYEENAAEAFGTQKAQPARRGTGEAFRAEVDDLLKRFPEWKDKLAKGEGLPEEVIAACAKDGAPLRAALAEYEVKQAKREIEHLRREIAILRQNAAAAAKAPVRGAAAGGVEPKGKDPFLEGLLSED